MAERKSSRRLLQYPRWEMLAVWGWVGTVEMRGEKLGLGYIVKVDCGWLGNDSSRQHGGDCLSRTGSGTLALSLVS